MKPDPTIDEVRRIRRVISAEYGNDPHRIVEYYMDLQTCVKNRLVNYGDNILLGRTKRCTGAADSAVTDSESLSAAR
jgi:hypothetical protein